jgi:cell division protein FtsL
MKDPLMVIPFVFVTIGLIFGAILGTGFSVNEILKLEEENSELRTQNERLQKIVKELDREQAERTKKTAEKNGV